MAEGLVRPLSGWRTGLQSQYVDTPSPWSLFMNTNEPWRELLPFRTSLKYMSR
jgi:hypothetical protein